MTRVLVSGAAGFVGSHIAEELVRIGIDVVGIDNLSTGKMSNLDNIIDKIDFNMYDIRERYACEKACRGVDVVCHQAALPSVPRSIKAPEVTNESNVSGTVNLLKAAVDNKVGRFLYAASSSSYGDTPTLPKVETMMPNPKSPYAVSKLAGEMYLKAFARSYNLDCISLKYFNVIGKRQRFDSPYAGVVPKFMYAALKDEEAIICGDGLQSRDFTNIKNVVDANIKAILSKKSFSGETVNIACGKRTTINDLLDMISKIHGSQIKVRNVPDREGDVKHSLADISQARALLGYEPKWSLEDALKDCYEFYKKEVDASGNSRN
jgi:nucleoside-diphosphate-sugar epimerase